MIMTPNKLPGMSKINVYSTYNTLGNRKRKKFNNYNEIYNIIL